MRILVIFPSFVSGPGFRRGFSGFSLMELMVVLVLLGLITSLALPNLTRLYQSISLSLERDEIYDQFRGLGNEALSSGMSLVLRQSSSEDGNALSRYGNFRVHTLQLPTGWSLDLDKDLIVRANGVCLGAYVSLYHLGELYSQFELVAPFCEASL